MVITPGEVKFTAGMTMQTRESRQADVLGTSIHPDTSLLLLPHSEAALLWHLEPHRESPAHGSSQRTSLLFTSKRFPREKNGFICCHELCLHHLLYPRTALAQQHVSSRPLVLPAALLADGNHADSQLSLPCTRHNCSWEPSAC